MKAAKSRTVATAARKSGKPATSPAAKAAAPVARPAIKPAKVLKPRAPSTRPAWWDAAIQTAWNDAKAAVIARSDEQAEASEALAPTVSRPAIAFGYGARHAYPGDWSLELEQKLAEDWRVFGLEAIAAWDLVRGTIQRVWADTSK